MARSPQQIFEHHACALIAGDIDEIVADYSDDAVFITPRRVRHGKAGVREAFIELLADLPDPTWDVPTQIFEKDVLFITCSAVSASQQALDGTDTFVFGDGGIPVQTVRYTLESTSWRRPAWNGAGECRRPPHMAHQRRPRVVQPGGGGAVLRSTTSNPFW
jgi:hypothetical protein